MISIRSMLTIAGLAAGLLPASAHHQGAGTVAPHYLVFWSGYQAPATTAQESGLCLEGRFWEKGFVSIYSPGERISEAK